VFSLLDGSPLEAEEVSASLGTDPDGTRRLLGALVAIGVLEREGTLFFNGSAASEFLVPAWRVR
jgi:DNA-binding IclR family transcriptional regulator